MPRLRVNPTILWLPNIVISLVSIIYISFIHLFVHFLGEIRMNWVGSNVMLTRYVSRFSVKYLLVVKCLLSGLMLLVARGSRRKIYWFRKKCSPSKMCFLSEFSFDFNQHSPRDIKCLIIGEGNLVLNISLDGTWVRIYGCLTTNDNQLFLFYKTIFLKWKTRASNLLCGCSKNLYQISLTANHTIILDYTSEN